MAKKQWDFEYANQIVATCSRWWRVHKVSSKDNLKWRRRSASCVYFLSFKPALKAKPQWEALLFGCPFRKQADVRMKIPLKRNIMIQGAKHFAKHTLKWMIFMTRYLEIFSCILLNGNPMISSCNLEKIWTHGFSKSSNSTRPVGLVLFWTFWKPTRSNFFQIALELIWFPIRIALVHEAIFASKNCCYCEN